MHAAVKDSLVVSRYHPLLVGLHWGLAVFILAALALGALKMAPMSNDNPMKYEALRAHMTGGLAILLLMSVRLAIRNLTLHPAEVTTGSAPLDKLAHLSHRTFYVLIIAMPVTGLIMAFQTDIVGILVGGHPPLPPDFWAFPFRTLHWLLSRALIGLIGLHLAGVAYHTFFRSDHLLRRMGFGARRQTATTDPPSLALQRISPWLSRLVLLFATVLFTLIGQKFVLDPAGAVREAGIALNTQLALTTVRASFGAFPLGCATVLLTCLLSNRRVRLGLWFNLILIGVVLLVRLYGIALDGTLAENQRVLTAEAVLLSITLIALALDAVAQRPNQLTGSR